MHDGSLVFSTALDNRVLEKDLERLKKKILREEESVGRIKFKKTDLENQLKAANDALDDLQKKTKSLFKIF